MIDSEMLKSPSVSHIVAVIEEHIQTGKYPDGRWLPSERELADAFGVSRITVRSAVAELEARNLVVRSPRCRPLVRRALTTPAVPSIERSERSQKNLVFWNWTGPGDPGGAAMTRGIQHALDPEEYRLIVSGPDRESPDSVLRSEKRFLERVASDPDIAGVILWYLGGRANIPALQTLRDAGKPMVFIDRRPPAGFDADYVGMDNEMAAREVVRHLIRQGHTRIAHLTNQEHASTVAERLRGYQRALEEAGLPFRPELVVPHTETVQGRPEVSRELLETLIGLPQPPTAVFAVNDYAALHFITALRAHGLRVPEDMAVAGFDGLERWWPGEPFLTTAMQPFDRMGEQALELLLRRITGDPPTIYQHIMLDAPLKVHASTASKYTV